MFQLKHNHKQQKGKSIQFVNNSIKQIIECSKTKDLLKKKKHLVNLKNKMHNLIESNKKYMASGVIRQD